MMMNQLPFRALLLLAAAALLPLLVVARRVCHGASDPGLIGSWNPIFQDGMCVGDADDDAMMRTPARHVQLQAFAEGGMARRSMQSVCPSVTCLSGQVKAAGVMATSGNASACCTCPNGTVTSYADEALMFRFQSDGITRDVNGSLVWNASTPSGLSFLSTMEGCQEAMRHTPLDWERAECTNRPIGEPQIATAANGAPTGLTFSCPDTACTSGPVQMLWSDKSVAIGAKHTAFFAVTLSPGDMLLCENLLGFMDIQSSYVVGFFNRPSGDVHGIVTTVVWSANGYNGPIVQPQVPMIVVFRSRYGTTTKLKEDPIVEMAVVNISSPAGPVTWVSEISGSGLRNYKDPLDQTAGYPYDLDFRDPAKLAQGGDENHAFAAGHMLLGSHTVTFPHYFQLRGTMHHLEFHSATLSDAQVDDVLRKIKHTVNPNVAPALPICHDCEAGTHDHDRNPLTACEPCPTGTFSAQSVVTECAGTCSIGSTVLVKGATTNASCSQCVAGRFGVVEDSVSICQACAPGHYSPHIGATSNTVCTACPTGKSSVLASPSAASCRPSGCTDIWAENYNLAAQVDEGNCVYTCSSLRARVGKNQIAPGGCVLHNRTQNTWQRWHHNGTAARWGTNFPSGETWIIQGSPAAGSTKAAPINAAVYECPSNANPISGDSFTLRHVNFVPKVSNCMRFVEATNVMFQQVKIDNPSCSDYNTHDCFWAAALSSGTTAQVSDTVFSNLNDDINAPSAYIETNVIATFVRVRWEDNITPKGLGIVNMIVTSTGIFESSSFRRNSAREGGAVYIGEGCTGIFTDSTFESNSVALTGGAIRTQPQVTLSLQSTNFLQNTAVGDGASLYLDKPTSIKMENVKFSPLLDGSGTVFIAGRLGGCTQHPCQPGYQCSYANYSLTCTPCNNTAAPQAVSKAGLTCQPCPAGMGPNVNRTQCEPCAGNTFSTIGVCQACPNEQRATADHTSCETCGADQTAVAVTGLAVHSCVCAESFYNASTLQVCFWDGFEEDALSSAIAARKQRAAANICDACPKDATSTTCLVCAPGGFNVAAGFTAPPIANTNSGGQTFVFRCHRDIDIARKRCPGTTASRRALTTTSSINPQCALGYAGHICGECEDDWGMNTDHECEPCEETGFTAANIAVILGMLVGIGILLFLAGKLWKSFSLQHLLRCSVQPARILITYSQVTAQLGDVLNFNYPGLFGDVLDFLKPIMDIWGLLFRALGPSECFGVQGFSERWLLRVVGLPGVLVVFSLLLYAVERVTRSSDRDQALMNLKGYMFLIVFFCYPTICIVAFAAFICTPMTQDITVLDMDDTVICESDSHTGMKVASSIVIAIVAIGVPVATFWVLWNKSRKYSKSDNHDIAKRIAVELDVELTTAEFVVRDIQIGRQFSFLMDAYKPKFLFWETMDMLRKLALVGLILLVGRGTIVQLSIAIILAFLFFALHVKTWPYKVDVDNIFRAATELHVFICILVALVMKNDLDLETVGENAYDMFLFISFIVLVPAGFCITILAKMRFVATVLRQTDENDARSKRRRALDLHVLGLGSDSDKEHLHRYIEGWKVHKTFVAFLSHYKAQAAAEARILKLELVRGLRVDSEKVFLDADNLSDLRDLLGCVRNSDALVMMVTDGVLSRPWCLAELATAAEAGVPIVMLQIDNAFRCTPAKIQDTLANLPQYLAKVNPSATKQLEDEGFDAASIGATIMQALNKSQADGTTLSFNPSQSAVMLRSQIHQLASTMVERCCQENRQLLSFLDLQKIEPEQWRLTRQCAFYIVYAESDETAKQAQRIRDWLCSNNQLTHEQVVLHTEKNLHLRDVDALVLLQTKDVVQEPSCLAKTYLAAKLRVPIVPVCLMSKSKKPGVDIWDFEQAKSLLQNLSRHMSAGGQSRLVAENNGTPVAVVGTTLAKIIPSMISKPLDVDSVDGDSVFHAQMLDIELSLRHVIAHQLTIPTTGNDDEPPRSTSPARKNIQPTKTKG